MNLTIGRSIPSTWKQIRLQHVTLIGGLAVAVSAFVALGGLEANEEAQQKRSAPFVPPAAAAARHSSHPVGHFYYIVDSQEQAHELEISLVKTTMERIEASLNRGSQPEGMNGAVNYMVIAADTREGRLAAEHLLAAASSEIVSLQEGLLLTVVDLRGR
jgi:hypothetical protein